MTDFRPYVQDIDGDRVTLQSILNRFPIDARVNLTVEQGAILRLSARKERGQLVISGDVRKKGVSYRPGDHDEMDLVRLSLPEPLPSFLIHWLSIAPPIAPPPRGRAPRSLATRVGDLLLPTGDVAALEPVVARYAPILDRRRALEAEQEALEAELNVLVEEAYGLDAGMRRTVSDARLPAELLGSEVGSHVSTD